MIKVLIVLSVLMLTGCSNVSHIVEEQYVARETIDVSKNVSVSMATEDIIEEQPADYEYRREPDIELPDVYGFDKDEYGNYILTEEMLNGDRLPFNEDGQIDYIYCYDNNGNIVNPMPEFYENYPQYFTSNGG